MSETSRSEMNRCRTGMTQAAVLSITFTRINGTSFEKLKELLPSAAINTEKKKRQNTRLPIDMREQYHL